MLVRGIVVAGAGVLAVGVGCGPRVTTGAGGGPSIGGGPADGDGGVVAAPALPDGDYACALTSHGTTFPSYLCRVATVAGVTRLVKLEGSHRVRGTISVDAVDRVGFRGEFYCAGGGCQRPLDTTFARAGDGTWTGDIGDGDLLRLEPRPDGMYAGAGYGADAWADDGYGGAGYGGAGYGGALTAWVAAPIDRAVPAGETPPDPVTAPLPVAPRAGDVHTGRALEVIVRDVAEREARLQSTFSRAPDRPAQILGVAAAYRELRSAAVAGLEAATDAGERTALEQTVAAAASAEARHLASRLQLYPKWCAAAVASDPSRSTGCADEALWLLGRAYEAQGQLASARKTYLQLIQDWPQSAFVPEAYFAFGELFLAEGSADPSKLALAQQSFAQVTGSAAHASPLWGYAQQRLGRIAWRGGDDARALAALKNAIEYGQQYASTPGAAAVAAAARVELVAVYARAYPPMQARAFMTSLAGDRADVAPMLLRLRRYYLAARAYAQLTDLDHDLITRGVPGACERAVERVTLAGFGGGIARAIAHGEATRLLDLASELARRGDPTEPSCLAEAVSVVGALAMAWDADAVGVVGGPAGDGDRSTRALAAALYAALGSFTDAQIAAAPFARVGGATRPTRAQLAARGAQLAGAGD
ncbi:MAG: tetratricopeptide repeat protein [Kofleriaceae bacterium]|nr:tetratricopeptide repeat protein [Kofleriaceae bacterium]